MAMLYVDSDEVVRVVRAVMDTLVKDQTTNALSDFAAVLACAEFMRRELKKDGVPVEVVEDFIQKHLLSELFEAKDPTTKPDKDFSAAEVAKARDTFMEAMQRIKQEPKA